MELVKDIFFNTDKLTQNSKVKISYTGKLFQEGANEVHIHYGFGLLWKDLADIKMEKTELGFQTEINLAEYDTFNFCFKNERNEWDNNNGQNYIFELEAVPTDLVIVGENQIDKAKRLRRTYLFSKKVKLAVYKLITMLPKLISGTYKKSKEDDMF